MIVAVVVIAGQMLQLPVQKTWKFDAKTWKYRAKTWKILKSSIWLYPRSECTPEIPKSSSPAQNHGNPEKLDFTFSSCPCKNMEI